MAEQKKSSLPSQEVFVVDVPEVTDLTAEFHYQYFVPDEGTNETGAVPKRFLSTPGAAFDTDAIKLMSTRVPRYVRLRFTPPRPANANQFVTEQQQKAAAGTVGQTGTLITDNFKQIVTEEEFSSQRFVTATFHDAELDKAVTEFVSGTYVQHTLQHADPAGESHTQATSTLSAALPAAASAAQLISSAWPKHEKAARDELERQLREQLPNIATSVQINAKFYGDLIARGMQDPHDHFAGTKAALVGKAQAVQGAARLRSGTSVSEKDYQPHIKVISVQRGGPTFSPSGAPAVIVGYVIERTESLSGGRSIAHPPIIIENPVVSSTIDLRVKYGAQYTYTIRTIAKFSFPAIDDETGALMRATALVSSRRSNAATVKCTEDVGPPPPADVGFTWNRDTERLHVHWAFPPNQQRDIKRFQVFRRRTIWESFQLIKMYDFDDSLAPVGLIEQPEPRLVERSVDARTMFVDENFDRSSKFIYAVGSVDAHGNVSPYSAQFEVSFDAFKNKLNVAVISHLGAPKAYPNMYLEADTFVDTMRDENHSRARLYFTPQCYSVHDGLGRMTPIIATTSDNGQYRLQVINPDAQKLQVVSVTLSDKRTQGGSDDPALHSFGAQ